jgi:hypothetical protein
MNKQLFSILILLLTVHFVNAQGGDPADGDATLPVVWKSFTGRAQQRNIVLNWETATERNAKEFAVQHSANGTKWDSIGVVTASGNTSTARAYDFTHSTAPGGTNHYRLLQRDLDGRSAFSKTISVKLINAAGLTILGNPVEQGVLRIRLEQSAQFTLYDPTGRLVHQSTQQSGMQSIDVSRLPKGYYTLKVADAVERVLIR